MELEYAGFLQVILQLFFLFYWVHSKVERYIQTSRIYIFVLSFWFWSAKKLFFILSERASQYKLSLSLLTFLGLSLLQSSKLPAQDSLSIEAPNLEVLLLFVKVKEFILALLPEVWADNGRNLYE